MWIFGILGYMVFEVLGYYVNNIGINNIMIVYIMLVDIWVVGVIVMILLFGCDIFFLLGDYVKYVFG